MYKSVIESFNRLAAKGKRPNFIFVGGSLFQLASLFAFANEKQAEEVDMCGVICDWVKPPHRRQIQREHISFLEKDSVIILEAGKDFDSSVYFKKTAKETIPHILRIAGVRPVFSGGYTANNPLYFFHPACYDPDLELWNTVLGLSNYVRFIQYDEGLGTYVVSDAARKLESSNDSQKSLKDIIRAVYGKATSAILRLLKELRSIRVQENAYLLFSKEDKQCVLNERRASFYKDFFCRLAITQSLKDYDFGNTILILGFDFAKLSNTIPYELRMFSKVAEAVEGVAENVVFRPHPSQSHKHIAQYQQLNMEIIDQPGVPLESILAASTRKPMAIIGLGSTAQITANVFWGIPCISIAKLLQNELESESAIDEALMFAFCQHEMVSDLFASFMSTPATYNELEKILKDILEKAQD